MLLLMLTGRDFTTIPCHLFRNHLLLLSLNNNSRNFTTIPCHIFRNHLFLLSLNNNSNNHHLTHSFPCRREIHQLLLTNLKSTLNNGSNLYYPVKWGE
jgi:hypothetical protein